MLPPQQTTKHICIPLPSLAPIHNQQPKGFFDAQKSGVPLSAFATPASRERFGWLEAPSFPNDAVPGGYFATGFDYVKVGL